MSWVPRYESATARRATAGVTLARITRRFPEIVREPSDARFGR